MTASGVTRSGCPRAANRSSDALEQQLPPRLTYFATLRVRDNSARCGPRIGINRRQIKRFLYISSADIKLLTKTILAVTRTPDLDPRPGDTKTTRELRGLVRGLRLLHLGRGFLPTEPMALRGRHSPNSAISLGPLPRYSNCLDVRQTGTAFRSVVLASESRGTDHDPRNRAPRGCFHTERVTRTARLRGGAPLAKPHPTTSVAAEGATRYCAHDCQALWLRRAATTAMAPAPKPRALSIVT